MRTVIITGTSSGLGKAFYDLFQGQDDIRLVLISRRFLPEQEQAANTILIKSDLADIATLPSTEQFSDLLAGQELGDVVFINNAAVVDPIGAIGELDPAALAQAVQVNVASAMLLTNALFAVPSIRNAQKLTVLNISSGAARRPVGGWGMYCAVKAGNEMFFDVLAQQFEGDDRVSVHNVNPGVMDTQMQGVIRAATGHFPTQERFLNLKKDNQLPAPEQVARDIVQKYLQA